MKTTHTPRPWAIASYDDDNNRVLFAGLCDSKPASDAAPELLAALKECERVLNANFASPNTIEGRRALAAMNVARAAIAKATNPNS